MGLPGRGPYLRDDESDPISSLGIDDECEAVEVEQGVESGIARPHD